MYTIHFMESIELLYAERDPIYNAHISLVQGRVMEAVNNFRGILPGGFLRNIVEIQNMGDWSKPDHYGGRTVSEFFQDVDRAVRITGLDPIEIENSNRLIDSDSEPDRAADKYQLSPRQMKHQLLIMKCFGVLRHLVETDGYTLDELTA